VARHRRYVASLPLGLVPAARPKPSDEVIACVEALGLSEPAGGSTGSRGRSRGVHRGPNSKPVPEQIEDSRQGLSAALSKATEAGDDAELVVALNDLASASRALARALSQSGT
jgi:hypothetical protein